MPSVSVIVPNYNHERYLRQRIDSILAQTYSDFELILLDDMSVDKSVELLQEYKNHPKVRALVVNEQNSGSTFKQWEKGIGLAQGKYIWIAESDDWAEPQLLERLVPLLERNENIGVAYCQSFQADAQGNIIGNYEHWTQYLHPSLWKSDFVQNGLEHIQHYLCQKNTLPNASAVLFRKSLIEKVMPLDTSYRICGDVKVWFDLLLRSDIAYVSTPLNYFRFHAQNVRESKAALMQEEQEKIHAYFLDTFIKQDIQPGKTFIRAYLNAFIKEKDALSLSKGWKKISRSPLAIHLQIPFFVANFYYQKLLYKLYTLKTSITNHARS